MSMFGAQFYHQSIRKYIVMFGNMFNDMVVHRLDADSNVVQALQVPLAYSPRDKFLVRLAADPDLQRAIAVQLPAASFEMLNITYDGSRRLTSTTRNTSVVSTDKNKLNNQYVPVPYNMNFALYIYVKNADDGAQILEQILPYFGPEWTNSVNLIPQMGIVMDIPTVLNDVNLEDTYEGDFLTRRALIYTFSFTVKGYFFGPVRTSGVIKRVQIDFNVVNANTSSNTLYGVSTPKITNADIERTGRSSRIVIVPGLTANGQPTSNSAQSISYSLISANSNYGIASNTFFFTDGKKYDPKTGQDSLRVDQIIDTNSYDWNE